jgi:hypothetical protein
LFKITVFLGFENISGGIKCDGKTLENVRKAIEADSELSAENKDKVWNLFAAMYEAMK